MPRLLLSTTLPGSKKRLDEGYRGEVNALVKQVVKVALGCEVYIESDATTVVSLLVYDAYICDLPEQGGEQAHARLTEKPAIFDVC